MHCRGNSKQINVAKELVLEKVKEEEEMRASVASSRQPRGHRYNQPLFLSYQDDASAGQETPAGVQRQEQLELVTAGDNCVEVFVSGVETPGQFWVQKVGPRSVELDKLTQEMTDFYYQPTNQELMAVNAVKQDDIVAATFGDETNFYRARVVTINVSLTQL